jgi:hypothetical protein
MNKGLRLAIRTSVNDGTGYKGIVKSVLTWHDYTEREIMLELKKMKDEGLIMIDRTFVRYIAKEEAK